MDLNRPKHTRDRTGRRTGLRRRQHQWRAAKASLGLALAGAVLSGPAWAAPYLQRASIHLPVISHPLQMAALMVSVVFVAGQIMLLILAISADGKKSQERYLELMHYWPWVLVAPVVILKTGTLSDRYFSRGRQHRSDRPEKDEDREGHPPSTPVTSERYRRALRLAMSQVPDSDPSPLTVQQYKMALRLAMERLSSLTMDRDLQELLMRQLESLEQHT